MASQIFTLRLLSKNGSLFDEYKLPLTVLPRVGEIIEASKLLKDTRQGDVTTFFVQQVSYIADLNGFSPLVIAQQWYRGFRHEELQQRGWLVPYSTDLLAYDEDEFYPDQN